MTRRRSVLPRALAAALLLAPAAVQAQVPPPCEWPLFENNAQPRPYSLSLPLMPRCASTSGGEEVRFRFQGWRGGDPWLSVSLCDSPVGHDSKITVYRRDAYFGTLQPISRGDDTPACGTLAFASWYPESTEYHVLIEGAFAGALSGYINVTVGNAQSLPADMTPAPVSRPTGFATGEDFAVSTLLGPTEIAGLAGDRGAAVSSSTGCVYSSWPGAQLQRCPGEPTRLRDGAAAVPMPAWPMRYGYDVSCVDPRTDTVYAAARASPVTASTTSSVVRIYAVSSGSGAGSAAGVGPPLQVVHVAGSGTAGWAGALPSASTDARTVGLSGVTAMAFDTRRGLVYATVASDGSLSTSTLVAISPTAFTVMAHPYLAALPTSALPINAFAWDPVTDALVTGMAAAPPSQSGSSSSGRCPAPASPNCGFRLAATLTAPLPGAALPAAAAALSSVWLRSPSASAPVLPLAADSAGLWASVADALYRVNVTVVASDATLVSAATSSAQGAVAPAALPSPGPWGKYKSANPGGAQPVRPFLLAVGNWSGIPPLPGAPALHAPTGRLYLSSSVAAVVATGASPFGSDAAVTRLERDGNATYLSVAYPLTTASAAATTRPDPAGSQPSKMLGFRTTAMVYDGSRRRVLLGGEDNAGLYRIAYSELSRIGGRDGLPTPGRAWCESCENGVGSTSATVGLIRYGALAVAPATGDIYFSDDLKPVTSAGASAGSGRLALLRASDGALFTLVSPDPSGGTPLLTLALDATSGTLYGARGTPLGSQLQWSLFSYATAAATAASVTTSAPAATAYSILPGTTSLLDVGVRVTALVFDAPRSYLVFLYGGANAGYYDLASAKVVRLEALPACGPPLLDLTALSALFPAGNAVSSAAGAGSHRLDLLGLHADSGRVVAVTCSDAPAARPGRAGRYGLASAFGEVTAMLPGTHIWAAHLDVASKTAVIAHAPGDGATGLFPVRVIDLTGGSGAPITSSAFGTVLSGSGGGTTTTGASSATATATASAPATAAATRDAGASASATTTAAAAAAASATTTASAAATAPSTTTGTAAATKPPSLSPTAASTSTGSASAAASRSAAPSSSASPPPSPSNAATRTPTPSPSRTPTPSPSSSPPPALALVLSFDLEGLPAPFMVHPSVACPLLGLVALTVGLPVTPTDNATWGHVAIASVGGGTSLALQDSLACAPLAATLPLTSRRLSSGEQAGDAPRGLQAAATVHTVVAVGIGIPAVRLQQLTPRPPTPATATALRRELAGLADVTSALLQLPGSVELQTVLAAMLLAARRLAAPSPAPATSGGAAAASPSPNALAALGASLPSQLSLSVSGVASGMGALPPSLVTALTGTSAASQADAAASSSSGGGFGGGFGAAIGAVAAIALVVGAVVLVRRRRRRSSNKHAAPGSASAGGQGNADAGAASPGSAGGKKDPAPQAAWVENPVQQRLKAALAAAAAGKGGAQ